jgi:uncharacterized surface protein with fasciclin (FAS1) repeats
MLTILTLGACAKCEDKPSVAAVGETVGSSSPSAEVTDTITVASATVTSVSTTPKDTAPKPTAAQDTVPSAPVTISAEQRAKLGTLSDVAKVSGYPTFVALVNEAGLSDLLTSDKPLTVAIPTEEAFSKVPAATLAALKTDKTELARVLRYHMVEGVLSPEALTTGKVPSLSGDLIQLTLVDNRILINGANIVAPALEAQNGTIFAIDQLLLPPKKP